MTRVQIALTRTFCLLGVTAFWAIIFRSMT